MKKNIPIPPRPPRAPGGTDFGYDAGILPSPAIFIIIIGIFIWTGLILRAAITSAALGPDPISAIQTKIMDHEYRILALENSPTPTRRPTRMPMPPTPTQEVWATRTPTQAVFSEPVMFVLYVRVNVRKCPRISCRWQYTMDRGSRVRVYPHTKTKQDGSGYVWIQLKQNGYWFAVSKYDTPFGYFE